MMGLLDDPKAYDMDKAGMFHGISTLGAELLKAWKLSEELALPPGATAATNVVVAGMGGSATAGDYFAVIAAQAAEIPVVVVRGYSLPNHVSDQSLVVCCSYSGNTEETLGCYDDAWKRGAAILVIATGGAIAQRAAGDGVPVYRFKYPAQPRAALAHSLAPLLRLGTRLDLCSVDTADVKAAADAHTRFVEATAGRDVPEARNAAKQLAGELQGRIPLLLAAEHLAPVASRFKNQVAENGKALGAFDTLPEADHNLIVGLATGEKAATSLSLVTLESTMHPEAIRRRFEVTCGLFRECGIPVHRIRVEGDSLLAQLVVGTAWGDFVSCYLGLLNGHDPSPVPQIDRLKAALAK